MTKGARSAILRRTNRDSVVIDAAAFYRVCAAHVYCGWVVDDFTPAAKDGAGLR